MTPDGSNGISKHYANVLIVCTEGAILHTCKAAIRQCVNEDWQFILKKYMNHMVGRYLMKVGNQSMLVLKLKLTSDDLAVIKP